MKCACAVQLWPETLPQITENPFNTAQPRDTRKKQKRDRKTKQGEEEQQPEREEREGKRARASVHKGRKHNLFGATFNTRKLKNEQQTNNQQKKEHECCN